jgi:PST family polysaccharide transporter
MGPPWTSYLPRFLRERLAASPALARVVGNTGWLFADRVLRLGVGMLVGVWVSRYLGPAQFGLYAYLLAVVALLAPLATLGLDNIVVRELVAEPAAARRLLGTAFALKLGGACLVLALAVFGIGLLHPGRPDEAALVAIIAAGTLVQAFDVVDLWFQAQTLARYTVTARSVAFLVASALKLLLIALGAPLAAFVWVALAEVVLGTLGSAAAFWRRAMPLTAWRPDGATARRLLNASWPLLFSGIAISIYMKIDVVMLTALSGTAATGVYAAALRLSEVWYFIPTTIVVSATPTILAARQQDEALYLRRLEQLFALMFRLALVVALPTTLLAYPLVRLLFGEAYGGAAPVLAIHIWSAVFVFFGVAQGPWDLAEDYTRWFLVRTVSGAVINVLLNLLLIPRLGAIGAALATALAQAAAAWLLNALNPRSRPIFWMQTRAMNPFRAGLLGGAAPGPPPAE